ncbi:hypothetical protein lerEdw1_003316 [Lerista edwardsae]|nr:hypothetical protein lerEdw1_003316 [Lerista edwardsae]
MKAREASSRERLVKVCLWITLLFYWISGILLTCLGVSAQVKLHETLLVLNEAASGIPVIVTVVGAILVLVSAFGTIALLKLNLTMIKMLDQTLSSDFLKTLDKYSRELQITKGVDGIQRQFQCCGAENYTDWLNTTFGSLSSSVPTSCCKVSVESCDTDLSMDTADIYQQGCVLKLKNWVEENMAVFGGMGIFIGLTQDMKFFFPHSFLLCIWDLI